MSAAEAAAFMRQPFAEQAVRLRRYDDRAKDTEARTPSPAHFRAYFDRV